MVRMRCSLAGVYRIARPAQVLQSWPACAGAQFERPRYGDVSPERRRYRGAEADNFGCLPPTCGKICAPAGPFDPTRQPALQAVLKDKHSQVQR